jgi:hypothetical protein
MSNRRPVNLELLIPILIGGFSLVGIVAVLLIGRALNSPAEIPATPSSTPFQYVFLGTEPAITTLVVDGSELPPTEAPTELPAPTAFILPTRTIASSLPRTGTPSRQPTATRTLTPSAANTYDDTDSRLQYSGSWIVQTGLPTSGSGGAYNGTLHISNVANLTGGNAVTVQFSGQEFYFYYQPASSFGVVTIYLDNEPLAYTTVSEAQGGVWHYVFETAKTHIVRIEHTSGGSINVDRFVIPAATPTPTKTPTP